MPQVIHRKPTRIPLGVDLDSTISDFPQAAIEALAQQGIEIKLEDWTSKRLDQCFSQEVDNALREAMNTAEFWMGIVPLPGVIKEFVKLLPGYEIHIVTLRPEVLTGLTHDWLCLNEIPFDTLTLVDRTSDKLPIAQELRCEGFIDDDPGICKDMHNADIVTGQYIWPWNHPYEDMIRLPSWPQLAFAMDAKILDKRKKERGF